MMGLFPEILLSLISIACLTRTGRCLTRQGFVPVVGGWNDNIVCADDAPVWEFFLDQMSTVQPVCIPIQQCADGSAPRIPTALDSTIERIRGSANFMRGRPFPVNPANRNAATSGYIYIIHCYPIPMQ